MPPGHARPGTGRKTPATESGGAMAHIHARSRLTCTEAPVACLTLNSAPNDRSAAVRVCECRSAFRLITALRVAWRLAHMPM